MCSNETTSPNSVGPTTILPYPLAALKSLQDAAGGVSGPGALPSNVPQSVGPTGLLPIDQYRLQLYNYAMAERLQRFPSFPGGAPLPLCPGYPPYGPRLALSMSLFHQRMLQPEEPKPQHSYIGLIAMAILSSPDTKLVLSDIYQYILDNYPYFRSRGPGWRNSIRHNLSLNDCFIKAGRSANGKGHYWAIHPANVEDFKKGDFRRRKAQRKKTEYNRQTDQDGVRNSTPVSMVRKHMGLAVDEEGNDSPSPPPTPASPPLPATLWTPHSPRLLAPIPCITRKRQFDVASLLAPDDEDRTVAPKVTRYASSGEEDVPEEDIDVVSSDADPQATAQTPTPTAPSPWPPQTPTSNSPLFMSSVEQHLVSRYYEQLQHSAVRRLALQQQQQTQQQQQLQHLQQQQLQQHLQHLQHHQDRQEEADSPSPSPREQPREQREPSPQ